MSEESEEIEEEIEESIEMLPGQSSHSLASTNPVPLLYVPTGQSWHCVSAVSSNALLHRPLGQPLQPTLKVLCPT